MRPSLLKTNCFYQDEAYGTIQFMGEPDDKYLFHKWEKSPFTHGHSSGWLQHGDIHLDRELYNRWIAKGKVKRLPGGPT